MACTKGEAKARPNAPPSSNTFEYLYTLYKDWTEKIYNNDIDEKIDGKDAYVQKPASLTIAEGRMMADAVKKSGRIVQLGSQQRSATQWRYAAELIRNGRIGKLQKVYVGLPGDPSGDVEVEMPIHENGFGNG